MHQLMHQRRAKEWTNKRISQSINQSVKWLHPKPNLWCTFDGAPLGRLRD